MGLSALVSGECAGRAWDLQTETRYREMLILGERPELASCLAAADEFASRDTHFNAIRLELDVSRRARVSEFENLGHLTRKARVDGYARLREPHGLGESWQPVEIVCEQVDEAPPSVRVDPAK